MKDENIVESIIEQIHSIIELSVRVGKAQERRNYAKDSFELTAYDSLATDLASKGQRSVDNIRDVLNKLIRKED